MTTISYDEYNDARGSYMGWCPHCKEFTRDSTEPDAEHYNCPNCGKNDVMGAEIALLTEEFEVEEE